MVGARSRQILRTQSWNLIIFIADDAVCDVIHLGKAFKDIDVTPQETSVNHSVPIKDYGEDLP